MRLYLPEVEVEHGGLGFMSSPGPLMDRDSAPRMLFKGNSSRLELLIEKIQANKENHHVSDQDIKGTPRCIAPLLLLSLAAGSPLLRQGRTYRRWG